MRGELLFPLPAPREKLPPVTRWSSTWMLSSIQTLKERGHYARYEHLLPPAHRDAVLLTTGSQWVAMDLARAHYAAIDQLGMSRDEALIMGARAGERAQGTVLKVAVRMAKGAGVTPWTVLPMTQKLWERGAKGGGTAVYRLGPKEAVVESVGCDLFSLPYFRAAYAGVFQGVLQMFCAQVYTRELSHTKGEELTLRFQWV